MNPRVVQDARAQGVSGGRSIASARPAKVSLCGVIWSSRVPVNHEEARFLNRAVEEAAKLEGKAS